ncbi:glycosyltransferase [Treponema sp. R8-4-B8]
MEINCKVYIIDSGKNNKQNIVEETGYVYYYCKDDAEKIIAHNEILKENDKTGNDVLIIDESVLHSININDSFLKELYDVLYYTEKHGFVSPRIGYADDPGYLLTQLKKLPRYSILAEPDIRCVLIKKRVIDLLLYFSVSYKSFKYSLLDFVQRANCFGFSIVRSNHIFLSYIEDQSDDITDYSDDKKLFFKLYPYYNHINKIFYSTYMRNPIDNFFELLSKKNAKKKILLNYYIMPCIYCGTSEVQLSFADAFYRLFHDKYDIYIYINHPADKFHHLSEKYANVLYPDTISGVFDLGFCAHQPFNMDDHLFMNQRCLKSVYCMHDIIMLRCDYVINEHKDLVIDDVVRFGFQECDGIVSISDFSTEEYKAYFLEDTLIQNKPVKRVYNASNFNTSLHKKYNLPFNEYYLIAGNHYKHKGVIETIKYVKKSNENFLAIMGMANNCYIKNNIYAYKSGNLDEDFISYLYINCKAVIFPSIYEGFGLPIAIALKNKKRVILYNNALNKELLKHFHEFKDYFFFFDRFSQINEIINTIDFSNKLPPVEYKDSWDQSAIEIEAFFEEILNTEINVDRLNDRWHLFNFFEAKMKEQETSVKYPCIHNLIIITFKKIIRNAFPGLYSFLTKIKQKNIDKQEQRNIKNLIEDHLI